MFKTEALLLCCMLIVGTATAIRHSHTRSYNNLEKIVTKPRQHAGTKDKDDCQCSSNHQRLYFDRSFGGYRMSNWAMEAMLEGQGIRMARLEVSLSEFMKNHTVSEERENDQELKLRELTQRLRKLEGTGCKEGEFQCGGDIPKCISNLLVCDGQIDCDTKLDEDQDTCRMLLPSGSIFSGVISGGDFCNVPSEKIPEIAQLVITRVLAPHDWLPIHRHLLASLTLGYAGSTTKNAETIFVKGDYSFALRRLKLKSPDIDDFVLQCDFDGVHEDKCICSIKKEANDTLCSTFVMKRQA